MWLLLPILLVWCCFMMWLEATDRSYDEAAEQQRRRENPELSTDPGVVVVEVVP